MREVEIGMDPTKATSLVKIRSVPDARTRACNCRIKLTHTIRKKKSLHC